MGVAFLIIILVRGGWCWNVKNKFRTLIPRQASLAGVYQGEGGHGTGVKRCLRSQSRALCPTVPLTIRPPSIFLSGRLRDGKKGKVTTSPTAPPNTPSLTAYLRRRNRSWKGGEKGIVTPLGEDAGSRRTM